MYLLIVSVIGMKREETKTFAIQIYQENQATLILVYVVELVTFFITLITVTTLVTNNLRIIYQTLRIVGLTSRW